MGSTERMACPSGKLKRQLKEHKRWSDLRIKFTGSSDFGQDIKGGLITEEGLEQLIDQAQRKRLGDGMIETNFSLETACDLVELIWWEAKKNRLSSDERQRSIGQLLTIYQKKHPGVFETINQPDEKGYTALANIRDRVMSARTELHHNPPRRNSKGN